MCLRMRRRAPASSDLTSGALPVFARIAFVWLAFASLPTTGLAGPLSPPNDPTDLLREPAGAAWRQCSGAWKIADGAAQTLPDSPGGLMIHRAYRSAAAPFTIEVTIRGSGASVLFGLDDTAGASVGHFVSVSGGTLETGLVRGASADVLTGRSALPQQEEGLTAILIDVDPSARSYSIRMNGDPAVEPQELVCPGGWIGLRSTDASASFRDLLIRTNSPAGPASRASRELSLHRLRYVRAGAGNLVVHDPERNMLVAMDLKGKVLKQSPPRFPVRVTTEASAGGTTYRISEGRLVIDRVGSAGSDAGCDTVRGPLVHAVALVADRDGAVYVTDSGSPGVHKVDRTGAVVRTWRARLLGGFIAPHGIDLLGTRELAVADYDRVVILAKDKDEEGAEITAGARNIVVEWALPSAVTPFAEVSDDGSSWRRVTGTSPAGTGKAKVVIGNLEPATGYLVRFGPVMKTIPASAGVSRVLEASTLDRDPSSAEAR